MSESAEKQLETQESLTAEDSLELPLDSASLETSFNEGYARTANMLEKEAVVLGASAEDVEATKARLETPREKAAEIIKKFKVAAAVAIFAGSLEAAPPEEKGIDIFSEDEIRRMVLEDEDEKAFLIDSRMSSAAIQTAKGKGATTPMFNLEEEQLNAMENIIGDIENGVLAHTHPLSAYKLLGYSDADINRWRESGQLPPAIAPSMPDLLQLHGAAYLAKNEKMCLRLNVYGTTGIWELEGEPLGRLAKVQEFGMRIDGILADFLASLDDPELRRRFKERDQRTKPTDGIRSVYWGFIEEDPELKILFAPYAEKIAQLIKESGSAFEDMEKLNELQLATARPETHAQAAKEYIEFLRESGVSLTFRPYDAEK